ncbi:uncharacterized protein LOC135805345 isoform X2 [Sycon ciliatum]|uniref:uncharacterized protein LOC135805345 isoform X2 n=1 Tax=Sycon ciliatum TaxID=27933 RepID=UPI0031F641BF
MVISHGKCSHELFPLLKLLADSHDRIPGQDHPEVMHDKVESLLRLELGKYDDTGIHAPQVEEEMDVTTQALRKQCERFKQQQICRIEKEFLELSNSIFSDLSPLPAPLCQPQGGRCMRETAAEETRSVVAGKRSADLLENRPSQLQLHAKVDNVSSSSGPPAKRRICASHSLDGRQRAEVTNDESADDTSVSRCKEGSPPDGELALISSSSDNDHSGMKPKFRHPPAVTGYLKEWYRKNAENPYPTGQEKDTLISQLQEKFGFTMTKQQLENWFINQRRRVPDGPNRSRLGSVGQSAAESSTACTAVSSTSTMQTGNSQSQLSSHTPTSIQSPETVTNTALSSVQQQMMLPHQQNLDSQVTSTLASGSILQSPATNTGAPIILTTEKPGVAKSSIAIAAPQQVLLLTPAPQPASTQPAVLSALSPPSLLPPVSGITVVSPAAIPVAPSPLHMVFPSAGTYACTQNPMPEVNRVSHPQPIHQQGYQGATTLVYPVTDNSPHAKLNSQHKSTR